jgi:predicted nucleotide-binding protein
MTVKINMTDRNVFVVHGRAIGERDKLVRIIRDLGMTPVVLDFAKKKGRSIYEEFLEQARRCEFAFVLLTPDDRVAASTDTTEELMRARQNVIFEMGWFFGVLGRERTRLLYKGAIELPSDITGVMYIKYDRSLDDIRADIRDALEAGGLQLR